LSIVGGAGWGVWAGGWCEFGERVGGVDWNLAVVPGSVVVDPGGLVVGELDGEDLCSGWFSGEGGVDDGFAAAECAEDV
jgi:hypothetical protein